MSISKTDIFWCVIIIMLIILALITASGGMSSGENKTTLLERKLWKETIERAEE